MNNKHLLIVNTEQLRNTIGNQKLEPQLSDEYKNAFSYYVRKLMAISNRCWSYDFPNIEEKLGYLEAAEVRRLINSTALSGKFSDYAYTYFTLRGIMKEKCEK